MTRRALLLLPIALAARAADAARDVWDLLSAAASALTADDLAGFLDCFDPKMPGFDRLRADATALLREAETQSSIELVSNRGDDRARALEVDWELTAVERQSSMPAMRWRAVLKIRMEKQGKRWRIAGLEPSGFFAPSR